MSALAPAVTALFAALLAVATASPATVPHLHGFTAYDNYPCARGAACQPSLYGISAHNLTRTGGWAGIWPTITDRGEHINGGVPQAANLTLHLDSIREHIESWAPGENWNGNGVLDFEAWTPAWDQNRDGGNWHGRRYQDLSVKIVQERHPDWNFTAVVARAKAEFQAAGVTFFAETLKALRVLRPKAQFGYYGFPQGIYGACTNYSDFKTCSYANPTLGPVYRKMNDDMAPIWAASGALFPSIYLPPQSLSLPRIWKTMKEAWVYSTTKEAVRLSEMYTSGTAPVRGFFWAYYHNGTTAITSEDAAMCIERSWRPPLSTSLVMWAGWRQGPELAHVMPEITGPVFKAAIEESQACAAKCSGRGVCRDIVSGPCV